MLVNAGNSPASGRGSAGSRNRAAAVSLAKLDTAVAMAPLPTSHDRAGGTASSQRCCTLQSAVAFVASFVMLCVVLGGIYINTSASKRPGTVNSISLSMADLSLCSSDSSWKRENELGGGIPEYFAEARESRGNFLDGLSGLIAPNEPLSQEADAKPQYVRPLDKLHFVITGGAGYIGSHAVLELLGLMHQVTILDNLSRGHLEAILALEKEAKAGQLAFYDIDLGDAAMLNRLMLQLAWSSPVDVVIHFAAVAYVGESIADPLLYYANVTANTANVLRSMSTSNVSNLIYSSSCATYGNAEKMPITEQTPQNPTSPYGQSKLLAEQIVLDHAKAQGLNAVILRYFNVIGSDPELRIGESPRSAVAKKFGRISGSCFAAALGHLDHLTILGTDHQTPDGTCVRDYIHVVDLVRAHIAAIRAFRNSNGNPQIFNVALGRGYSVREFVNACKNVTAANITVIEGPKRDGDPAIVYADASKVKRDLEWEPQFTDLRESLMHAWQWSKAAKY